MKGFALLTAGLVMAIFSVTAIVMMLLPLGLLKIHMVETVGRVYEYDNTQSYLLILLSKTHDGNLIYTQMSENLQIGSPDISFVKTELDTLTGSKCFKLTSSATTIAVQTGCIPTKYSVQTKIVLPYNPDRLTETLKLVVD